MILPKSLTFAAILTASVAALATPARAGFVTYTAASAKDKPTDFTTPLAIQAFDTSLGGWKSVVISIADEAKFSGSVSNHSVSAKTFAIKESVAFAVSFNNAVILSDAVTEEKDNIVLNSGGTYTFGPFNPTSNSGTSTILDPNLLSLFTGPGLLNFSYGTIVTESVSGGGGNSPTSFTTTADSVMSITYNYISPNIVPEPASLAMTAMGGLIAAAGLARTRARKSR